MMQNFGKVKKKSIIIAALLSVAAGVCAGLLVAGALLVAFRLSQTEVAWWVYLVAGLGAAVLGGGIAYLIFLPTDKRVARKLDRDYSLGQKVQTMVEFSSVEQPDQMVLMQRMQADEAIGSVAKGRLKLGGLWKLVFIPVLAAAMFVGGMLTPVPKSQVVVVPPPIYDMTQTQRTALLTLIRDVEESELDEGAKPAVLDELNGLLEKLEEEILQSEMKEYVISSVRAIDDLIAAVTDYTKVYAVLDGDEKLSPLSDAIVDGTLFYKAGGADVQAMATVVAMAEVAPQEIYDILTEWSTQFTSAYAESGIAQIKSGISDYASSLYGVLVENNADAPAEGTSALFDALRSYITELIKLSAADTTGLSDAAYRSDLAVKCSAMVDGVTDVLCGQSYSCMMDDYIRNSLARIFGLSRAEIGSNEQVVPDDDGSTEEPPPGDDGWSDGDIEYGSDDLVLDPDTLEMVPYGQLIDKYKGVVDEMIASGATPEELILYLNRYFDSLYGGLDEE